MTTTSPRYALITGCGQGGIGEALAKEYMSRGIVPIATVLPSESSQHLSDAKIPCGICYTMPAADTDVTAAQKMFDVNLFGPMRMVHVFHDMIIRSKGTIVNIGSIGGVVPYVYGSSYNATKAALHHWSSTLRVEMAPFEVKVLTIISGEIGTNFLKTDRDRELPKNSFYLPLASEFKEHVRRTPDTTSRFKYAENVVSKSMLPSPPAWFWYGHASFLIHLIDTFAPRKFWDFLLWNMFKFDKLKNAHHKRGK
ncbi:hypothetical protein F5B21DRAFT_124463 [Xylaria acuta]|nr:hypothetical protein F5B21DRAFT_124463 [Xylaria acuta]